MCSISRRAYYYRHFSSKRLVSAGNLILAACVAAGQSTKELGSQLLIWIFGTSTRQCAIFYSREYTVRCRYTLTLMITFNLFQWKSAPNFCGEICTPGEIDCLLYFFFDINNCSRAVVWNVCGTVCNIRNFQKCLPRLWICQAFWRTGFARQEPSGI